MQMRHRLAPILPLTILGTLALVSGLCAPATAQDNTQSTTTQQSTTTTQRTTTTTTTTTTVPTSTEAYWESYYRLPEAPDYPEVAPGTINLVRWTDWTETVWEPGSIYDYELDRWKADREFWVNREHTDQMGSNP